MSPKRRPHLQGFTLIELLTVIAIIGILAAILIPTVGKVRESAKNAGCQSNLRQLGMAMQLYANENKSALPTAGVTGQLATTNWKFALGPFLSAASGQKSSVNTLRCPSRSVIESGVDQTLSSYSLNPMVFAEVANDTIRGTLITRLQRPQQTVLIADAAQRASGDAHGRMFNLAVSNVIAQADTVITGLPEGDLSPTETATVSFRHGGKMNVVMADGSVRGFGTGDLLNRYFSILRY